VSRELPAVVRRFPIHFVACCSAKLVSPCPAVPKALHACLLCEQWGVGGAVHSRCVSVFCGCEGLQCSGVFLWVLGSCATTVVVPLLPSVCCAVGCLLHVVFYLHHLLSTCP
jgi:hypothetical protein